MMTIAGFRLIATVAMAAGPALLHAQTPWQGGDGGTAPLTERSPWVFQASGLISHFRDPQCESCEYRTSTPGIGLQRDLGLAHRSRFAYTFSAGLQNDSFGRSGGYAAAVASLPLSTDSLLVRPGLGAFGFYRYMNQSQGRVLVPAILPVLSVEGRRSGIGATLLLAPNFSYAGTERSGFVFLQFTFRLGRN